MEKENYKKMRKIKYKEFKIQQYFMNPKISKHQAKEIFKFRIFMHSAFKDNFKNNFEEEESVCSLCGEHRDNQNEIESCEEIKKNIPERGLVIDYL